ILIGKRNKKMKRRDSENCEFFSFIVDVLALKRRLSFPKTENYPGLKTEKWANHISTYRKTWSYTDREKLD
ncbi:hypothetical protein CHUAL_002996, partial [Chamberlinius hualienensis]